jgi:hypothetical protein
MWFSIVPLLANFFQQLPKEIPIQYNELEFTIIMALPFSWEVLWVASFFFFLAFCLYHFFCPKFVKEYRSYQIYKDHNPSPRWIAWLVKDFVKEEKDELPALVERLITKRLIKNYAQPEPGPENIDTTLEGGSASEIEDQLPEFPCLIVEETCTKLIFESDNQCYELSAPIPSSSEYQGSKEDAEREIFWELFGRYTSSHKWARLWILIFLFVSGLCVLFVLGQNMWTALSFIILHVGDICREFFTNTSSALLVS